VGDVLEMVMQMLEVRATRTQDLTRVIYASVRLHRALIAFIHSRLVAHRVSELS